MIDPHSSQDWDPAWSERTSGDVCGPLRTQLKELLDCRYEINQVHSYLYSIFIHEDIYIYAFSRCFYPKQPTVHSGYTFFVSMYFCQRRSYKKIITKYVCLNKMCYVLGCYFDDNKII